jgi:hypothetical protein
MTLPSSGQIAFSDLSNLIPSGDKSTYGYSNSLSWVDSNSKDNIHDMNSMHGRDWYASSMNGNCNNGNCGVSNCNCGNKNCPNCLNCGAINCSNCDSRPYLQADCNCNCTYNCTQSTHSYDCDCNCFACW